MSSEIDDLEHHLDLANKTSLVGASSPHKSAALAAVSRLRNKFDAFEATVVREFEATAEYRAEGHGSSVDWRKHHTHEKGPGAARARRLGGWMAVLPFAAEALADGAITADHLQVLARAQELIGEEVFAALEPDLVELAGRQRFDDFERTIEYWIVRLAPADAAERERRAHQDRHASSSPAPGGGGRVKAEFDALGFLPWNTELDRLIDHLVEEDRAEARDRLGRAPVASELRRSPGQRRLDAMELMARRSAAFGDSELGAAPICLNVIGDLGMIEKVLQRLIDALKGDGSVHLDDLEYHGDSLHELEDGTVITVNTILLAVLTGTVRGVLFDPDGEVLRYGHARRLFTRAQAQLFRILSRRCQHPHGCDRTGHQLECDHRIEWDDGGRTDADNGQCLCHTHNIWKTNHKHDPPPDDPDQGGRRTGPDAGPPPPTE